MSQANAFATGNFYRIFNSLLGKNFTLSLGYAGDSNSPSPLIISQAGTYSSENWQIFPDSGIYFLRNHDWGDVYQLGVSDSNLFVPQMLVTGNDLAMQWNITQESGNTGTWLIRNQLLNQADVLGVDIDANKTSPFMNTDLSGGQWIIDINLSAGAITSSAMLASFPSIQVR